MSEIIFSDANFESEVIKHKGLVLVDFFADWCGPCKMMAPVIEKMAEEFSGKMKIGKLNVDNNPNISMKFEIQSIPTLIFFKDGEMVDKLIGYQSEEVLRRKIDELSK
jgi:thioredoxin 1